ncbi:MAG TPA: DivIVA domain-containing protein [Terrimesophilobacter sp.]|nr:DivIVA domain-containing protein [Terrimesophilobacter sp.]HRP99323.1 DivIVA domain-containing protein [Terrimesophilobacter sp.]
MALTPEDVVNKRFAPTKFREGYDQDEVDDFLDEVVVELRRLGQENEELRQRLIASDARINELQRSGAGAAPVVMEQPPVVEPMQQPVAQPEFTPAGADDSANTNNLLQLARRLHEEHVREGVEKRDALIAEGHAAAAKIVSDAESGHQQQLQALEAERRNLEQSVEDLRTFEREYRQKLKGHLEGLLQDLSSGSVTPPAQNPNFGVAQENPPVTYQGFAGA